tara:strand:+ start:385 stop:519 length:135 start_codon:yes stop_codon:yes gene_type:complete
MIPTTIRLHMAFAVCTVQAGEISPAGAEGATAPETLRQKDRMNN